MTRLFLSALLALAPPASARVRAVTVGMLAPFSSPAAVPALSASSISLLPEGVSWSASTILVPSLPSWALPSAPAALPLPETGPASALNGAFDDDRRRNGAEVVPGDGVFSQLGMKGGKKRALAPELIKLLKDLVRTASVNGVDSEEGVAAVIESFAHDYGIRVERFEGSPGRPVLKLGVGPEDVPGLVLVAHTDTVGVGDESRWRHPPFAGVVDEGKLYGRGALDNKGGLVAAMGTLLKVREMAPRRSLTLLAVPDEEAGATGELGIRLLQKKGKLQGLGAIYAYPGLNHIIIGHRGVWRFQVGVVGESQHTGSRHWQRLQAQGANALTAAAEIILAIEGLSKKLADRKGGGFYSAYSTVLSPVVVQGGQSYGMSPEHVRLKIDGRLVPDVSVEELRTELETILAGVRRRRPDLAVSWKEDYYIPPSQADAKSKIVRAVQNAAARVLGQVPPLQVSGPANESYLLNGFDIPTVIIGPSGEGAHSPNEHVDLDSVETASRIYVETWKRLGAD